MAKVSVSWVLPAVAPGDSVTDHFEIDYSSDGGVSYSTPVSTPDNVTSSVVLDNVPAGNIDVRVAAVDADGDKTSVSIPHTAADVTPTAPAQVEAENV